MEIGLGVEAALSASSLGKMLTLASKLAPVLHKAKRGQIYNQQVEIRKHCCTSGAIQQ
jgi:hypothetical protein